MRNRLWIVLAACALISAWSLPAVADEEQRTTVTKETRQVTTTQPEGQAGRLTRSEMIFRSSKLTDFNVFNSASEKIGSLSDLVVDAHTGQVMYGILSSGGVLGIGDKLIAVPWNAFRLEKNVDRDQTYLVLNVEKDRFKDAPTFTSNNWPNFTNEGWARGVDQFFGVRTAARPTTTTPSTTPTTPSTTPTTPSTTPTER